ncbi:MAG: cytochrome-c peroxidase [Flavobacteriales bacterium]|nr:MAG: cytochrome-c peroxidase [Flavobacteriales bacterium]
MRFLLLISFILIFGFCSCRRDVPQAENSAVQIPVPDHFPPLVYTFERNPPTTFGVELGRKLFFDPFLSRDGLVSCSTCHQRGVGFADPRGQALSEGVFGRVGNRNTPALANLIWYPHFNWDGGINHIEIQPVAPITDSAEMDMDFRELLDKLQKHPEYPDLFQKAFGSDSIYSQVFLFALTQFMSTLVSHNAPIDDYYRGQSSLTTEALAGKQIFDSKCATCHSGALQTDFSFRVNGLTAFNLADRGRAEITNDDKHIGAFRVPSLRNVEVTGPYLHDGSLSTLREVIEAYSSGILNHPNLDSALPVGGFNFSDLEKRQLRFFLYQLTDFSFINPN